MTNETLMIVLNWMGEHPILTFMLAYAASHLFHFVRVEYRTEVKVRDKP